MERKFIVSDVWDGQQRMLYSHICPVCNCEFFAPPKQKAIYCSRLCYDARRKKIRTDLICRVCDKTFSRLPSKMAMAKHSSGFCSRQCKDVGQSHLGNCPDIHPAHYGSEASYEGRIKLDKCTSCGESRRFLLLTHHIDGNRKHNKKENLECVCFNCHVIRHLQLVDGVWRYWTKSLTPRDKISELTKGL